MKYLVNENLKDELITRLVELINKDKDDKPINLKYLRSLSEEELDSLILDYSLSGIEVVKNKLENESNTF